MQSGEGDSVYSRRIKRIKSFNQAMISRTGTSTNSGCSENIQGLESEKENGKNMDLRPIPKSQRYSNRKSSAPLWLNDWITSWLEDQEAMSTEVSSWYC